MKSNDIGCEPIALPSFDSEIQNMALAISLVFAAILIPFWILIAAVFG